MQLHQLRPINKTRKAKRVGRGGKRGTYSGRGQKGQKSRAGRKLQPVIRELIKRYPKLRGYRSALKAIKKKYRIALLNLDVLEKNFSAGEKITPAVLLEKKIIRRIKGRLPLVKILSRGSLTKTLIVEGCLVSAPARDKIKKAGGAVK